MKLLISTIYRGKANRFAIHKLGVDKVAFLVDEPPTSDRTKAIEKIKKQFKDMIKVETVKTSEFEVPKIVEDVLKYVNKQKFDELIFHASEARKTMFLGCLYAASILKKKCYYVKDDDNQLYSIPLFNLALSKTKIDLLRIIADGETKKVKIAKKLGKHRSLVYNYLNELIRDGFLDKDYQLTETGRIAIIR